MKMSRACTGMWSSENDDFKCSTTTKNIASMCIMCAIVPGLVELLHLSKPVCHYEKHEHKSSHRTVLYGPHRDKTCLRGFGQIKIQTSLLSYRD